MSDSTRDVQPFFHVFRLEAEVITARRRAVAEGQLAEDRGHPPYAPLSIEKREELKIEIEERVVDTPSGPVCLRDERGRKVPRPGGDHNLTGLALSGGGIRSAAFCLGVLQGLDAIRPDHEPQVLDQIDYLSTVSGGGYIGTSLVAGLMQSQGKFPFASKLDQEETLETQHLRDYSNFLIPNGAFDVFCGLMAVLRGLLLNVITFLALLLALAALTVAINPTRKQLVQHVIFDSRFHWTIGSGIFFIAFQTLVAVFSSHLTKTNATLKTREALNVVVVFLFGLWLLVAAIEFQTYVLTGVFQHYSPQAEGAEAGNAIAHVLDWFQHGIPTLWGALLPAAAALATVSGKLAAIIRTTAGDRSWPAFFKGWISFVGLCLVAGVVPFTLWYVYLHLSFWGIENCFTMSAACAADRAEYLDNMSPSRLLERGSTLYPQTPGWILALASQFASPLSFVKLYLIAALGLAVVAFAVRPNVGSLHSYYRDRLSRAFLWQLDKLRQKARQRDRGLGWFASAFREIGLIISLPFVDASARNPTELDVDTFRFSSLKKREASGDWTRDVRFAPYLLVNTAVNLEASPYLNRRGRNADSFIFSPLFIGSEATRYVSSGRLEAIDLNLNLGTAMATSGAALSANMGASTIRMLTFSLAALNVRLGYWLPNPERAETWNGFTKWLARVGPIYFALETLGFLDEKTANVYLTDGGHFDNLGLYELLKRRCKLIIAIDAEADPLMNFESFIRLQRYARIDLGVRIDLFWEGLRRSSRGITTTQPFGPLDDQNRCNGPHVSVGRIEYDEMEIGVIIYIKASLSGDENDLVRDYKRRHQEFPHETTADQFFSEEQFEVYRALGFHITKNFFNGSDDYGRVNDRDQKWVEALDSGLRYINIPKVSRAKLLRRL